MLEYEELILEMQKIDTDKCARLLLKEAGSYKLEDPISQLQFDVAWGSTQ